MDNVDRRVMNLGNAAALGIAQPMSAEPIQQVV